MGNPLTSEAAAFRWLVAIAAVAGLVIAVALLTRPLFGIIAFALVVGWAVLRWLQARDEVPVDQD